MERYKFEDLISDYIENKLPVAKRKEVEAFMEDNPEAKDQLESIRALMNSMKDLSEVKTSDNFMENLMKKVEFEKNRPSNKKHVVSDRSKTYFGFTPVYVTAMSCLIVALVVVALQLMPTNNLNSISIPSNIAEQESKIPTSSNTINADKDLMLAEDDDTTNTDNQNRLIPNSIARSSYLSLIKNILESKDEAK